MKMSLLKQVFVLTVVFCVVLCQERKRRIQFRVAFEWTLLDYLWPSPEERIAAIESGAYIPENNIVTGVECFGDKLFLTMPRWRHGVPATLVIIPGPNLTRQHAPLLEPFPSWEANQLGDCGSLQNVQSVKVDTQGILWVIDGGRTATMEQNSISICPPKLILYDLLNNANIIRQYEFPNDIALHNGNFLNDLVIDDYDGRYAYITDNSAVDPGLIVYSYARNKAWKVRDNNSMLASPDATHIQINDTLITASIPIDGIAMDPISRGPERLVYYTPVSSNHIYTISSAILRNEQLATSAQVSSFVTDLGTKASQTDGMIMDENGILYFGLLSNSSIIAWNSSTPFIREQQKAIARDARYVQWPDSFSLDDNGNLYVTTNRIQNFLSKKIPLDEANYRILYANVGARSYLFGPNIGPTEENVYIRTLQSSTPSYATSPGMVSQSPGFTEPSIYVDGGKTASNTQYQIGVDNSHRNNPTAISGGIAQTGNTILFSLVFVFTYVINL